MLAFSAPAGPITAPYCDPSSCARAVTLGICGSRESEPDRHPCRNRDFARHNSRFIQGLPNPALCAALGQRRTRKLTSARMVTDIRGWQRLSENRRIRNQYRLSENRRKVRTRLQSSPTHHYIRYGIGSGRSSRGAPRRFIFTAPSDLRDARRRDGTSFSRRAGVSARYPAARSHQS